MLEQGRAIKSTVSSNNTMPRSAQSNRGVVESNVHKGMNHLCLCIVVVVCGCSAHYLDENSTVIEIKKDDSITEQSRIKCDSAGSRLYIFNPNSETLTIRNLNTGKIVDKIAPQRELADQLIDNIQKLAEVDRKKIKILQICDTLLKCDRVAPRHSRGIFFKILDVGWREDTIYKVGCYMLYSKLKDGRGYGYLPVHAVIAYDVKTERYINAYPLYGLPWKYSFYDASVSPNMNRIIWHGANPGSKRRVESVVCVTSFDTAKYNIKPISIQIIPGTKPYVSWSKDGDEFAAYSWTENADTVLVYYNDKMHIKKFAQMENGGFLVPYIYMGKMSMFLLDSKLTYQEDHVYHHSMNMPVARTPFEQARLLNVSVVECTFYCVLDDSNVMRLYEGKIK
jgi:hypothetical protein